MDNTIVALTKFHVACRDAHQKILEGLMTLDSAASTLETELHPPKYWSAQYTLEVDPKSEIGKAWKNIRETVRLNKKKLDKAFKQPPTVKRKKR